MTTTWDTNNSNAGHIKKIFSPSLMCMDLLDVRKQILELNAIADMFHIDIMDGHFANSIHLSPSFVKSVARITELPIDVHLMVDNPSDYIEDLILFGASILTLHIETIQSNAFRLINKIKGAGCKVGLAICPETPIDSIKHLLGHVFIVTILNVDIGFAGQNIIPGMIDKTRELSNIRTDMGLDFLIQSDGGVRLHTIAELIDAGSNAFVLGTALFDSGNPLCDEFEALLEAAK